MADSQVKEHNKAGMRRLLDMYEVATALNVGRSTAFAVVLSGELRSVKVRGRRLVPVEAIDEYIARLATD